MSMSKSYAEWEKALVRKKVMMTPLQIMHVVTHSLRNDKSYPFSKRETTLHLIHDLSQEVRSTRKKMLIILWV